jgi:Uma2 family endonuclease
VSAIGVVIAILRVVTAPSGLTALASWAVPNAGRRLSENTAYERAFTRSVGTTSRARSVSASRGNIGSMTLPTTDAALPASDGDQRIRLHGVAWEGYEALLAMRGEGSAVRVTYLRGEVELMAPGRPHEKHKTKLARLLEAWAEEQGVLFEGFGSWTLKKREAERGAEADECYVVGRPESDESIEIPDIAIEVVETSGGIDKLEVYRGLGVREVWFWQRARLTFHALRGDVYEAIPSSEILPGLDTELIARCMQEPSQTAAVAALRSALRERRH